MFIRIEAESVDVRIAALAYNKTEIARQMINIFLLNPYFLSNTANKTAQSNIGRIGARISIIIASLFFTRYKKTSYCDQ
jgi:hypothetical protein